MMKEKEVEKIHLMVEVASFQTRMSSNNFAFTRFR